MKYLSSSIFVFCIVGGLAASTVSAQTLPDDALSVGVSDTGSPAQNPNENPTLEPVPRPPESQTETVSQALLSLEKDIQSQIKTFSKSTQLFHYFNAPIDKSNEASPANKKIHPSLNNKASRDSWVNFLIGTRTGVFWDLNYHITDFVNAGPGMYFAIDPDSSKEFGDTAVIITAPEGAAFISVLNPLPLRKETLEVLVSEKIITTAQLSAGPKTLGLNTGFTRFTLKNMLMVENNAFRTLLGEIFKRNNISFIEYEYKSHLAGFCKVSSQSAFVFIGAQPEALATEGAVMGKVEPAYQNAPLFSSYTIEDLTDSERGLLDLTSRFKDVLAQIRLKGTGLAAKNLILKNLTEPVINDLADKSYLCTRRY